MGRVTKVALLLCSVASGTILHSSDSDDTGCSHAAECSSQSHVPVLLQSERKKSSDVEDAWTRSEEEVSCKPSSFSKGATTSAMLDRAVYSPGELSAWSRVLRKFLNRMPMRLLVLGGSVEARPWSKTLCDWLQSQLPGSECLRGARGASGVRYLYENLNHSGLARRNMSEFSPDLVLLGAAINPWDDPCGRPFDGKWTEGHQPCDKATDLHVYYIEKTLRALMQHDFRPLPIGMNWFSKASLDPNHDIRPLLAKVNEHLLPFEYYRMPALSMTNAFLPHFPINGQPPHDQPALNQTDFFMDFVHPSIAGGNMVIDIITGFICRRLKASQQNVEAARHFRLLNQASPPEESEPSSPLALKPLTADDAEQERQVIKGMNATEVLSHYRQLASLKP
eukprot:TRINITY_DN42661_c0_g1_i1.p1 TRINITY_DN42661_c0_g1~~TRINITY_DN42661_c0_g1_i1.p1  ORF type:complete len:394 (+),score=42.25 TRINITY_DN42661_c0_g1_i1:65-1246(+)